MERGYGSVAAPDKGGGDPLASQSEGVGGEGERFVFKWGGLEVGEIDGVSLHTTERERVCLTETGQRKEKQFISVLL